MSKICGCCLKPKSRIEATYDGVRYCSGCYQRHFRPVPCESCGKTMLTPGGKTPAICRACRTKDRTCAKCGKALPAATLNLEGGGSLCHKCYMEARGPAVCAVCGEMKTNLSRDVKNGFLDPTCNSCRRKTHKICPSCKKHQRMEGLTSDGKLVCRLCLEQDGKPFVCPKCKKEGQKRQNSTRCENCYWKEKVEAKFQGEVQLLARKWVQTAFNQFVTAIFDRGNGYHASRNMAKHFQFFKDLDAAFEIPGFITSQALLQLFRADGLRRYEVPYAFLKEAGILPEVTDEQIKKDSELLLQIRIMDRAKGKWYGTLLRDFRLYLVMISERYAKRGWVGKNGKFGAKTVTSALRNASRFLESMPENVENLQQIEQNLLDRYMTNNPGCQDGVRNFVRYLNNYKKLFVKLKIPYIKHNLHPELFLDEKRYVELMRAWLSPTDEKLKESLICVLMLLYAQEVTSIVQMKVSDLQHVGPQIYRVAFGRAEIRLDPAIGELMDRWLVARHVLSSFDDEASNEYLFPGRSRGTHLALSTVGHYLKKYNVTGEVLYSTAIYRAYLNGMRYPKALIRAFGLSNKTAVRYLMLMDPRLRQEAEGMMTEQ